MESQNHSVGRPSVKTQLTRNQYAALRLFGMLLPLLALFAPGASLSPRLPLLEAEWETGLPGLLRLAGDPQALAFLRSGLSSPYVMRLALRT